jgi:hypothetical protein
MAALALALSTVPCSVLSAANVFLDFGAAWVTELNDATTAAGVANFSPAERAQIEANILASITTAYSPFTLTFFTTDPGGTRERIDFGATTASPTTFGVAPLDFRNVSVGTQSIFTQNFSTFIESAEPRATQIAEISLALAGTAAHELGHSLGMHHHAAYGTAGITPANYSNTAGLQNAHIMATGSTGLSETQRETQRTFSRWSKLAMEAATGITLVASPLSAVAESGDAGNVAASAQPLTLTTMPQSGLRAALVQTGSLNAANDVDYYSFVGNVGEEVSVELWSLNRYVATFDGQLSLIGPNGVTVLATNNDVQFNGNSYNSGAIQSNDPFLLNIPLTQSGTHYIRVDVFASGAAGDDYDLLVGVAVPEPSTIALVLAGALALGLVVRRKRISDFRYQISDLPSRKFQLPSFKSEI